MNCYHLKFIFNSPLKKCHSVWKKASVPNISVGTVHLSLGFSYSFLYSIGIIIIQIILDPKIYLNKPLIVNNNINIWTVQVTSTKVFDQFFLCRKGFFISKKIIMHWDLLVKKLFSRRFFFKFTLQGVHICEIANWNKNYFKNCNKWQNPRYMCVNVHISHAHEVSTFF